MELTGQGVPNLSSYISRAMPLGMALKFIHKPRTHRTKTAHSSYRKGGSPFTKGMSLTFLVASTLFLILIYQVVAPEAAHPFCKENIIILFIFHVQTLRTWGGLPTREEKARSNATTKLIASNCSANKRKQRHSFSCSFCSPSPQTHPTAALGTV